MFRSVALSTFNPHQLCSCQCSPKASTVTLLVIGILITGVGIGIGQSMLLNRVASITLTAAAGSVGPLAIIFGLYRLCRGNLNTSSPDDQAEVVFQNDDVKADIDSVCESA